ncbi:MAG: DUF1844 domain-containing protein [Bdellovibrionales bacterium]|nr:DUF1844 domain-containing protein [Bdellovibrionales bacterium]
MSEDNEIKVNDKRGQTKEVKNETADQKSNQDQSSHFPEANFIHFVASLGTSCMMHLGLLENPNTKEKEINLEMAQHEIDLLAMLEEKTKGNLDAQESNFLSQLLFELRMHFVKVKK